MKKINYFYVAPILPFLISLILVGVWFWNGSFLGGGEEALAFWNIGKYLSLYKGVWIETGLGYPWVIYLPKLPMFYLINLVPSFNTPWLHQAVFFLITLFLGTLGIYLLVLELTGKKNKTQALIASLFYLFNTYSISQIFGRFVYQGMTLWASLPLFLTFLFKWLKRGSYINLFFLTSMLLLFSYAFVQPAYIVTLWFSAFLLFLSQYIVSKKEREKLLARFIALFLLWLITNVWWIYPYLKVGPSSLSGISGYEFNFASLRGVSQFFPTGEILLLRQKFLFGEGGPFFSFYSQSYTIILSIIALAVAILGWLSSRGKSYRLYLTITALVAWFICKGTNPPFGFIFYNTLFSNFPITSLFRNPYEKFGIVWLIVYSILFGIGAVWLVQKLKNNFLKIASLVLFLAVPFLLGKPMWDGSIFPKSLRVSVPTYYASLNERMVSDKTGGRVLVMPMTFGEAVKYKWGYDGAEPSEYLIDAPPIARMFFFDKVYDNKFTELYNTAVSDKKFDKLLNEMNITYLTFNDDYIVLPDAVSKTETIKKTLASDKNLKKIGQYGAVTLYKNMGNEFGLAFEALGDKPPKISYVKKSPEAYTVTVSEAKAPFILVFKSEFNNLWQASINRSLVFNHEVIYDYANSWKIDKTGSYKIDVLFKIWPWE